MESAPVISDAASSEDAGFSIGEAAHEDVYLAWWRETVGVEIVYTRVLYIDYARDPVATRLQMIIEIEDNSCIADTVCAELRYGDVTHTRYEAAGCICVGGWRREVDWMYT